MKRKFLSLAMVILICLSLTFAASAASADFVVDGADLLSDSEVVDFASQEIFETQEEMLAYKLRSEQEGTEAEASERNVAAEKAANDLIEQ